MAGAAHLAGAHHSQHMVNTVAVPSQTHLELVGSEMERVWWFLLGPLLGLT